MKIRVIVNLCVAGVHRWANCNIQNVEFLKDYHRHLFHICCKKDVNHTDRDTEIISLKEEILEYLNVKGHYKNSAAINFDGMSCEMIAKELTEKFNLSYCSVLEDNENGAEVIK